MTFARGYRRLSIAIVGSWIAVWTAIGGFAAWRQRTWSDIFLEASADENMREMVLANQRASENAAIVEMALLWGLLALPLALGLAIIWWVVRGFQAQ
ncbi:hypothetical protein [Pelagerythrobacter aerophilus]|uniref:Uncharacterized protein n=1 Tax=Pelagerythrobacter aerophilus TaxID=2306995 RepID=A0A418NCU2_9SPHN|nr:hypothetical protein [Pelagerythrobacter aerophilus]RIV75632.1 hypothetical protein D2V04_15175 [Pelagerythrobacter aerophilus]